MKHILICLICTVMLFAYIGKHTMGEDNLTTMSAGGNAVARVAIAATNQPTKKEAVTKASATQVGILLAHADNLDTARFRNTLEKGLDPTIKINTVDTAGNVDTQKTMFDKMIESGYNLIVMEMQETSPAEYFVDKAGQASIPMIIFGTQPSDELLNRYHGIYYIGFSGGNLVEMMSDEIAKLWSSNPTLLNFEKDDWDLSYSAITSKGFADTGLQAMFDTAMKSRDITTQFEVDSIVKPYEYDLHKEIDQTIIKDSEIVIYDSSAEVQKAINYYYDPTEFKKRPKQQLVLSSIDDGAIELVNSGEVMFACGTDTRELGTLASRLAGILISGQAPNSYNIDMELVDGRSFYLPYSVIRANIEPEPVETTEE